MSREAASRMLAAVSLAGAAFALAFVLLPSPVEDLFYWLVFGATEAPASFSAEARDYVRFVYGVLGAVMAGWLALVAWVALGPLRKGEEWAWPAVAATFALWYGVDTTHSLVTGYPENALLNTGFAIGLGLPLFFLRPGSGASPSTKPPPTG